MKSNEPGPISLVFQMYSLASDFGSTEYGSDGFWFIFEALEIKEEKGFFIDLYFVTTVSPSGLFKQLV